MVITAYKANTQFCCFRKKLVFLGPFLALHMLGKTCYYEVSRFSKCDIVYYEYCWLYDKLLVMLLIFELFCINE